jgi:pSer/pThr/pTyr-binding forkhead associated (FHA) protein
MGFQLTIAAGQEAGKEFVFDQASVVIGRNSDCDVVLYDAGISRKHARIFRSGDVLAVEDLGSSNGTLVNGARVEGSLELQDGDALTLGPVVFQFSAMEQPPAEGGEEGGASTRIVSMEEIRRQRNKGSALAPKGAGQEQLQELGRAATSMHRAIKPQGAAAGGPPARPGAGRSGPPARGGAPGRGGVPAAKGAGGRPPPGGGGLSAAERARLKREGSPLSLMWAEASPAKRGILVTVASLLLLGMLGGGYMAVSGSSEQVVRADEPATLGRDPVPESFGLGEGVDFARSDSKTFNFEVSAPGEVAVLLHYQSGDIQDREVSIAVNGVEVGFVPADRLGSDLVNNEVLVPVKVVKRNDLNSVIFDNVKNPPGQDPWRIWNPRVEVVAIPQGTPEELLNRAQQSFRRGQLSMDAKDVGAENRYRAWREYRTAWLSLEGLPDKPDLYGFARDKVKEAQRELDSKCNALMLSVRNHEIDPATKNFDRVKEELRYARSFFPGKDQPCFWKIRQKMDEYDME